MNIGANGFGLRIPFYKDLDGSLSRMKEGGLTSIEACVAFPSDPEAFPDFPESGNYDPSFMEAAIWPLEKAAEKVAYVREAGFAVISAHVMSFMKDPSGLLKHVPAIIQLAKETGITNYVFSPMKSAEELLLYVPVLNEVCEALNKEGIKLLIHNHEQECVMIGDKTGLEVVLEQCPLLGVELDVGWAKFGGCDAVALMKRLQDRLVLVHLKDIKEDASPETRDTCFTAVGEGSIPLADIVKTYISMGFGPDTIIIDQDNSDGDMVEDIIIGVKNVNEVACS